MTRIQTITTILSQLRISYHLHYDCNTPDVITVSTEVMDSMLFREELTIANIFFEQTGIDNGQATIKIFL